jgi:hypothetical protein
MGFGGREPGQLNRRTREQRMIAAEIAERQLMETKTTGKKLAREVLQQFMITFHDMAVAVQPVVANGKKNPRADANEFERWAMHACEVAKWLAPYQSPTFKAIGINAEMRRHANDDDEAPVCYRTVKEIRAELARRGLPPLQHIIEAETDEDGTYIVDAEEP